MVAGIVIVLSAAGPAARQTAEPLAVARILAGKYPAQPNMSYIPALSWSSSFRLSAMTKEPQWRDKANKDIQPFVTGQTPAIAERLEQARHLGRVGFEGGEIHQRFEELFH